MGEDKKDNLKNNKEDIELFNLVLVIWKWKYLIMAGVILITTCFFYYYRNLPDDYIISFKVEKDPSTNPNYIISKLDKNNKPNKKKFVDINDVNKYAIKINKQLSQNSIDSIIEKTSLLLKYKTKDKQEGILIANKILNDLIYKDKSKVVRFIKITKSIIQSIQKELESQNKALKRYNNDLIRIKNINEDLIKFNTINEKKIIDQSAIEYMEFHTLKLNLVGIENDILTKTLTKLEETELNIKELNSQKKELDKGLEKIKFLKVINEPNVEVINSNIKIKVIFGFIISCFIMVFSVFLIEYIENFRKNRK